MSNYRCARIVANMSLLTLRNVCKEVGHRMLLSDVNFSLERGEMIGLQGLNGSGKTTLLRVMAGLSRPTQGTIEVLGQPITASVRKTIGVVFQESMLYGDLTVRENLLYYAKLYHLTNPQDHVDLWLEKVHLSLDADEITKTLSKGMRQRVSIARALLPKPQILLLDEPFDGLDARHTLLAESWFDGLVNEGSGVIFVSHDENQVIKLATRRVTIDGGYLLQGGLT